MLLFRNFQIDRLLSPPWLLPVSGDKAQEMDVTEKYRPTSFFVTVARQILRAHKHHSSVSVYCLKLQCPLILNSAAQLKLCSGLLSFCIASRSDGQLSRLGASTSTLADQAPATHCSRTMSLTGRKVSTSVQGNL
jgi:hypothetical protein